MVVVVLVLSLVCTQVAEVLMVRQALQEQKPAAMLQSINNANRNFFIVVILLDVVDITVD